MTDAVNIVPHKIWSEPFRFIFLPWVLVFLVIFYWFSFVPLLFAYFIKTSHPSARGKYIFLSVQLLIFFVILAVLVYVWKAQRKSKKRNVIKRDYCSVVKLDADVEAGEDIELPPTIAERRRMLTLDLAEPGYEEVLVRSQFSHRDPRPLSQNLEVALTPRELFFRELYESVYERDSAVTREFIEQEREHSSLYYEDDLGLSCSDMFCEMRSDSPIYSMPNKPTRKCYTIDEEASTVGATAETKVGGSENVSEYFVANVTPKCCVTSEAFLYVHDETKEAPLRKVSLHFEDDDIYRN